MAPKVSPTSDCLSPAELMGPSVLVPRLTCVLGIKLFHTLRRTGTKLLRGDVLHMQGLDVRSL